MVSSVLIKRFPIILAAVAIALIGCFVYYMAVHFMQDDKPAKKMVQQVTLIAPPPPPPPPPEMEPEIEEEQIEEEVPEEVPEEAMPEEMGEVAGDDLGIDADGTAGSDGFGLVGRKGGRGLLGGGNSYTQALQAIFTDIINNDDELRYEDYLAIVRIWVNQEGALNRFEVDERSGNEKAQQMLELALAQVGQLERPPPLEMPQPIKFRLRNRL